MTPTKQVSGKNVATLSPAQQARTTVPEIAPAPADVTAAKGAEILAGGVEVVTELSNLEKAPSLRIASDAVKAKSAERLSHLVSEAIITSADFTKRVEAAAKEMRAHRLMFPAHADTLQLLGDNAPDLAGRTRAYTSAWNKVAEAARIEAAEKFIAQGASQKVAEATAATEYESFRKSVSRRYRLNIEAEAKKLGTGAGVRFLLAHGFERNGECGPNQLLTKGASLALPVGSPEGTVLTVENAIVKLPTTASTTTPPVESSDQAKPGETGAALITDLEQKLQASLDAQKGAEGGGPLTNPLSIVNLCVGMLNDAADLMPEAKTSLRERNAARDALLSAVKRVVDALEGAKAPATK